MHCCRSTARSAQRAGFDECRDKAAILMLTTEFSPRHGMRSKHIARRISSSVEIRCPKLRLQTISCFTGANSSRPRHGSPRSSRTVRSRHDIKMLPDKTDIGIRQLQHSFNPHGLQFLLMRRPTPQTSSTGSKAINFLCLSRLDRSTTPPVCRCHCFAA